MKPLTLSILLIAILTLTACGTGSVTETATLMPTATFTPSVPTPTSLPMALRVNGEGILLSDYQAELARLIQAETAQNAVSTPEEQKNLILQDYIDHLLLAQAAAQNGYNVDDATLQAHIDKLANDIGGMENLTTWQANNGYTMESFKNAERLEMMAIWQRDAIINAVPTTAEQIHALAITVQDEINANDAYQKLQNGTDFAELALLYDPTLGGDIGWFARGTLTQPVVDEAVFALQPGQYTAVIKSEIGYHILYVLDRDPQHTLSKDGLRLLRNAALIKWLEDARAASTIEILVP